MYQILIVEDDIGLNRGIALALKEEGTEFVIASTLSEASALWRKGGVDMILLDVNLPDGNGYDLLKEVRTSSQIPVIMLTANDLEIDEVTGLRMGADDYITKPFRLMVLRARVDRMRSRTSQRKSSNYEDDTFCFSYEEMCYLADGQEIVLSKTEQKLLRLFTEHQGQTLTRELLVDALWTEDSRYVDENALSVTVNRLRRKLESKTRKCPIQTVYGIGYVWEKKE